MKFVEHILGEIGKLEIQAGLIHRVS